MRKRTGICIGVALLSWVTAETVWAHHSFAAFDGTRKTTVAGVVKEFQWTNPHCWLFLTVQGANGAVEEWQLEALSPNVLGRQGWKRNTVKPGEKVTVVFNPMRDGSKGGALISLTDENGNTIGGGTR
ncbi:MAG: DUF6152 family protein [Steroidobacteraceae bacterium]